ncbi:MAG: hypothetical protein J6M35_04410 [Clostridia bacterium]|nr:hypothetical protein [Clostridia bacterium]
MKTAAKIFIIIGMVVGFWSILPLIFGFIALNKLKKATNKSDIIVAAVLALIFCNMIGGILMLCIPETEFAVPEAAKVTTENTENN